MPSRVAGTSYWASRPTFAREQQDQHRRGLYVIWKRAAPYPSFVNFDANGRVACRVHRPRSNTPLQALTLMNDPVYVEAAMALAGRVLRSCGIQRILRRDRSDWDSRG